MVLASRFGMLAALSMLLASTAALADWTRFRGPNGSGISAEAAPLPVEWSETKNLKWKVSLPGPGSSCPIVVGKRVFVTCWSGYGTDRENPGDQSELRRHLICLDRETGNTLWSQSVEPVLPEDEYGGMFAEHGYASHTPVSDGERVYVYFGKTGALAFDLEGKQLWQTGVGTESDPRGWGSASSPILYKDLLIVSATAESEALVALDKATGEVVWRQEASGLGSTWGTPILVAVDQDRTDLVIAVPNEIWGLNPETGELRWYCEAMQSDSFCSSLVADQGVVYAIEGRGGGSIAVRVGGRGDVTETHVVWTGRHSNRIGTPVLADGRLYFFSGGVANSVDAATGERVYQARLEGGSSRPQQRAGGRDEAADGQRGRFGGGFGRRRGGFGGDYASPILADGKIYSVSRSGDVYVIEAGKDFRQLAVNAMGEAGEDFSATPAVSDGALFIRSSKHLVCVSLDE